MSQAEKRMIDTDYANPQLARPRTMATVTDDPLGQKVEMTNWEKVSDRDALFNWHETMLKRFSGSLHQLQVCIFGSGCKHHALEA